jgi:hypothetical protein
MQVMYKIVLVFVPLCFNDFFWTLLLLLVCEKKFVKTKWDLNQSSDFGKVRGLPLHKTNPLTLAKSWDCHYIKSMPSPLLIEIYY